MNVEDELFAAQILRSAQEVDRMYMEEPVTKDKDFELHDIPTKRDELLKHFEEQAYLVRHFAEVLQQAEHTLSRQCGWKMPAHMDFGFDIFRGDTALGSQVSLIWRQYPKLPIDTGQASEVITLTALRVELSILHYADVKVGCQTIRAETIRFPEGTLPEVLHFGEQLSVVGVRWAKQIGWINESQKAEA